MSHKINDIWVENQRELAEEVGIPIKTPELPDSVSEPKEELGEEELAPGDHNYRSQEDNEQEIYARSEEELREEKKKANLRNLLGEDLEF